MRAIRPFILLTVLISSFLFGVTTASPAGAVGCYGHYSSAKDPVTTGCSADGQHLGYAYLPLSDQYVEIRVPDLQDNWARVRRQATAPATYCVLSSRQRYRQVSAGNTSFVWTKMIYSPTRCVYGQWILPGTAQATTACY